MSRPWPSIDDALSHEEGWGIFDSDARGLEIERLDEANVFGSDAEALAFVRARAAEGSELHKRALKIVQGD